MSAYEITTQWVQLGEGAGDGPEGYIARPAGREPAGAVIVAGEMFGVPGHLRDICGRFAAQGFVYNDLSRACLAQSADPIPRVALIGRLATQARWSAGV